MKVVCVLTNDKYHREDVFKLKHQVEKKVPGVTEFICITDRDSISGIQTISLPMDNTLDGWWNKLYMFDSAILSGGEKVLYLDLDTVIQNNLEYFLKTIDWDSLTVVYPYWKPFDDPITMEAKLNSSVITFRAGSQQHIWDYFDQDFNKYCIKYRGIDGFITNEGFAYNTFDRGWIYSRMYGRDAERPEETRYCYYNEYAICLQNGMKGISHDSNYDELFNRYYKDYDSISSIT